MDKIDVVLFRYKSERKLSKEFKKMLWIMATPLIILPLLYFSAIYIIPTKWALIVMLLWAVLVLIWVKIIEGKWGPKKWKNKWMNTFRNRFKADQTKLIEIIKDEGMNCQQFYNLLLKRHSRIPPSADKSTYAITIISLLVALTAIFASPLQHNTAEQYATYVGNVVAILVCLLPAGWALYKFIVSPSKQYDEKKNNYEYVLKLLEDCLY